MKSTKVKILKNTVAAKKFVSAGEIVEIPMADAVVLLGSKKAELVAGDEELVVTDVLTQEIVKTEVEVPAAKPAKSGRKKGN